jgi:hypothetical protein
MPATPDTVDGDLQAILHSIMAYVQNNPEKRAHVRRTLIAAVRPAKRTNIPSRPINTEEEFDIKTALSAAEFKIFKPAKIARISAIILHLASLSKLEDTGSNLSLIITRFASTLKAADMDIKALLANITKDVPQVQLRVGTFILGVAFRSHCSMLKVALSRDLSEARHAAFWTTYASFHGTRLLPPITAPPRSGQVQSLRRARHRIVNAAITVRSKYLPLAILGADIAQVSQLDIDDLLSFAAVNYRAIDSIFEKLGATQLNLMPTFRHFEERMTAQLPAWYLDIFARARASTNPRIIMQRDNCLVVRSGSTPAGVLESAEVFEADRMCRVNIPIEMTAHMKKPDGTPRYTTTTPLKVSIGRATLLALFPEYVDDPQMQASHLCGHNSCSLPIHIKPEATGANNARKMCHGLGTCRLWSLVNSAEGVGDHSMVMCIL